MQSKDLRADAAAVMADIAAKVEQYGMTCVFIGGSPDGSWPFHYTIGRGNRGLPELLLVAPLHPTTGKGVLNELDQRMPAKLPSGSLVDLGGKHPVKVIDADQHRAGTEYMLLAKHYHRTTEYQVQQVILCDPDGRFPPDCATPWDEQPFLGLQ